CAVSQALREQSRALTFACSREIRPRAGLEPAARAIGNPMAAPFPRCVVSDVNATQRESSNPAIQLPLCL
ncbi:MAG TPA: hypothetical protein PLH21_12520, partial [Chiayiivirga sp.]|nr:hypothetical protein [Chiayiivirga sp.]